MATEKKTPEVEETEKKTPEVEETEKKTPVDPWKDMVPIKLFKDNGNYKSDVTVGVNGRMFTVQRGVRVEVPRCVAKVLENSQRQDQAAAIMLDRLEQKYQDEK